MPNRHRYSNDENESYSFWQSYSDLMSALLLIFVLVMSATLLQAMNLYHDKMEEEAQVQEEMKQKQLEHERLNEQIEGQLVLIEEQQAEIEKLVGVKEEIIVHLSKEFSETDLSVAVDPKTGSIAFDSSILFAVGSYDLTDEGKAFLDSFIPVYFDTLMHSDYSAYIAEIIIEGHTDTQGAYMYNLELSQKRALSVCKYCLDIISEDDRFDSDYIRSITTANGRSWSNPIYSADGKIDMDASRRVEFKFTLKDDEMINKMKDIFENEHEE